MAPSSFAERFGYARWLRHLATGEAPSFAEIGRAVERTGQAVSGWATATEAPTDWRVHEPLAAFLGSDEAWLIKNTGEPPMSELWGVWIAARQQVDAPVPARRVAEPAPDTPRPPLIPTRGEPASAYLARVAKEKAAQEGGQKKTGGKGA